MGREREKEEETDKEEGRERVRERGKERERVFITLLSEVPVVKQALSRPLVA